MGSNDKKSALFEAKAPGRGHSAPGGTKGRKSLPVVMNLEDWQEATSRSMRLGQVQRFDRDADALNITVTMDPKARLQARARVCLRKRMADLVAAGKPSDVGDNSTWADVGDRLSPPFSGPYLAQVVRGARPASKGLLVALGLVRVKKDSRRRLRFTADELADLSAGKVPAMVRQRARAIVLGEPGGRMIYYTEGDELPERVKQARFVGGPWDGALDWIPEHADFVAVPHLSPDGAENWVAHYSRVEGPGFVGMVFTRTSQGPERKEA